MAVATTQTQPGRWRRAWAILLGREPAARHVCVRELEELRVEWREYELTLTSYMEKMNAWAARVAKREKRAAQRLLELEGSEAAETPRAPVAPPTTAGRKAMLRRQFAASQGLALGGGATLSPDHGNGGDDP